MIAGKGGAGTDSSEYEKAIAVEKQFEQLLERGENFAIVQILFSIPGTPPDPLQRIVLSLQCLFANKTKDNDTFLDFPVNIILTNVEGHSSSTPPPLSFQRTSSFSAMSPIRVESEKGLIVGKGVGRAESKSVVE